MNVRHAPLQTNSISTQVYLTLKKKILEGELKPYDRLPVLDIANGFRISQAPVREALERLKQEGLIIGQHNKGSVVSNITSKEIKDIFILREMIEGYAVRQSIQKLKEFDFELLENITREMDTAIKQNDLLKILELDMDFHGYLYERCDNYAVLDLWNSMKTKIMRFMAISNKYHSTDGLVQWHQILIDALRQGDADEAEAMFINHMHSYKTIHVD
ncbi:GntR family transcriptional regulator [Bacillus sp. FJAT-49711]|uniref:GntR family transcriptional regulator n=1 Tax=Bacillus sp. FJAT-49711 TaxID=2833585 RepID=UPI001BCA5125|nr:GntR family transcriptional regulator [Bacillus sp. FJAT-49711]MBS4219292.1 GntR family transcriptional regulator [Bacillus sp. FJAT-49711]